MPSFFDLIAPIYDETRGLPPDTMDEVISKIAGELQGNNKVLDLGVGTGRFAYPMKGRGIDMVGLDINQSMLGKARSKGLENILIGDARKLPFNNETFEAVISVHLLHLVEDHNAVLKEIRRVCFSKLISVIYNQSEFQVFEEYKNAIAHFDYELETPGFGETGLKEKVKPSKMMAVKPFEGVLNIGERIKLLENRKHSYTLDTPEDVHGKAMDLLKDNFKDRLSIHAKTELEIAVWDIADIPDHY